MTGPAGERRIVSVLVTDLVDSTTIAESLGPERSKFLLDEVDRACWLPKCGALKEPSRSSPATGSRAVRGTCRARRRLGAGGASCAGDARVARRLRGGRAASYGIEFAAGSRSTRAGRRRRDDAPPDVLYNALGDTVNVAARLQSVAGAGGVAVGPATARERSGRFALEPLGELGLKGSGARLRVSCPGSPTRRRHA